jgi:hypothetical protein
MNKLKYQGFQYAEQLARFVNSISIEVISITSKDGGEGYMLFYVDVDRDSKIDDVLS